MPISNHDLAHLDEIIGGKYGDWFTAHLLRLIKKADRSNREKLREVFPVEVQAVEDWENGDV